MLPTHALTLMPSSLCSHLRPRAFSTFPLCSHCHVLALDRLDLMSSPSPAYPRPPPRPHDLYLTLSPSPPCSFPHVLVLLYSFLHALTLMSSPLCSRLRPHAFSYPYRYVCSYPHVLSLDLMSPLPALSSCHTHPFVNLFGLFLLVSLLKHPSTPMKSHLHPIVPICDTF